MNTILNAAVSAASMSLNEHHYVFLKKLCQVGLFSTTASFLRPPIFSIRLKEWRTELKGLAIKGFVVSKSEKEFSIFYLFIYFMNHKWFIW